MEVLLFPTKVFISYSHDSPAHARLVLSLANQLREHGVDATLDQYETRPRQGWPHWCELQLRPEQSDFVLMICTSTYRDRVENRVPADEGRDVFWEGALIYQYIYETKSTDRFIPVVLPGSDKLAVPVRLREAPRYRIGSFDLTNPGYASLYRVLTHQSSPKPPLRAFSSSLVALGVGPR